MPPRRTRRHIAARLALVAMALNASWPLLANARPAGLAALAEICSATGPRHFESDAPSQLPDECVRHCALCSLTSERGAALPVRPAPPEDATAAPVRPDAEREKQRFRSVDRFGALPRAPPFHS